LTLFYNLETFLDRTRTTHIVLSPLEFLAKLAALVPPPRVNLVRYHGVLPPNPLL
jgi:hypothetical protein